MKNVNLLIWVTQLGLSVALPLGGFILLGVATAGIGTFLAFFHDRLGRGKVEPDSTDDGGNGA